MEFYAFYTWVDLAVLLRNYLPRNFPNIHQLSTIFSYYPSLAHFFHLSFTFSCSPSYFHPFLGSYFVGLNHFLSFTGFEPLNSIIYPIKVDFPQSKDRNLFRNNSGAHHYNGPPMTSHEWRHLVSSFVNNKSTFESYR